MLKDKVSKAIELIKREKSKHSIVMSSFGKDSMVLLDLVRQAGVKLPILFFKEPFFPEKYKFANEIILENNYTVYDYPPLSTAITKSNDHIEIANFYQVGTVREHIFLPTGIHPPKTGEAFLCGLYDLLDKPTGTFKFPWDTVFIGHKSSDVDPLLGSVKLKTDAIDTGPVRLVLPLKNFTDEDIWAYHLKFNVPIHHERYNKEDGYKEHKDKTFNPDYFPACTLCIDKDETQTVFCPKSRRQIQNISALVNYQSIKLPDYIG